MTDWQETLNDIARLEADNAALKKLLTEKDALIHQLGENAATAAREYAENMAALRAEVERYKAAYEEYGRRLSWMQGHPALPARYFGWHIADAASDLIGRSYPQFSEAITRAALTERKP